MSSDRGPTARESTARENTDRENTDRTNTVPGRYRGVAVASVEVPLDLASLRAHLLGREAYWKTRFVVAHRGRAGLGPGPVAVVAVTRADPDALFAPITGVDGLAGPDECALLERPDCDTAIPSALVAAAVEGAPGARAVVVLGRYGHVNFVLDPQPLAVTVREVVPPYPPKLLDQAARVLAVAETVRPVRLCPEVVEIAELAASRPSGHYLLPCRGGGAEVPGAELSYLDERPPRADWTLVGCARSREIHHWFYGDDAPTVDICPLAAPPTGPLLTKCCLQQEEIRSGTTDGHPWVSVPWGASLDTVREALESLNVAGGQPWSPA